MSKTNFLVKRIKNISNFIINLLEKNLNKLNSKNLSYLFKNNKIILTFVALFVIFVSYLLLPTFFNQTDISKKLKNEVQVKKDLNFRTSVLDLRHIFGSKELVQKLKNEFEKIQINTISEFIILKLKEQNQRHKNKDNSIFSIEKSLYPFL